VQILTNIGFTGIEIHEKFDPFRGTSKERTAVKYGVQGVNVFARKPERAG